MKILETRDSQTILEKKKQVGELTFPDFKFTTNL